MTLTNDYNGKCHTIRDYDDNKAKYEPGVIDNIICRVNSFIEIGTEWLIDSVHCECFRKEYWQCINALEPGP